MEQQPVPCPPVRPDADAEPVVLRGGTSNDGLVLRIGDTVHRPRSRATEATHALLRHLEDVGFDGAPRVLGIDERGREVLSFVPGTAVIPPYPAWALSEAALASVANLLRRYHEAVRGFDPTPYAWGSQVPAAYRTNLVGHNDPNLDNIVFRDGEAVALIDFDLASPGSALWDVAMAARLWVPLRDPRDVDDARPERMLERLRLFVTEYGLPECDRRRLAAAAMQTHGWAYDIVHAGAFRGQPGYRNYWTAAARAHDQRGRQWFIDNLAALEAALAG